MTMQHPLRFAALVSLLAYLGAVVALLWRRPRSA
jgi:hypothetical protein